MEFLKEVKNKEELKIEELHIEEYDRLKDILAQQQLYHYNLKGPYSERFLRINERKFKEYMGKKKKYATYIAIIENEIIGFTSAYINNYNEGFIEDLFVSEKFRKNQIGTRLFEKILKWLENNNVERINIEEVSIGNENVLKFYEKFGFKMTGYTMMKIIYKDS